MWMATLASPANGTKTSCFTDSTHNSFAFDPWGGTALCREGLFDLQHAKSFGTKELSRSSESCVHASQQQ